MKYFRLIWSGLWRKRTRTLFTLVAIAVAFTLFGILQGVNITFKQLVQTGRLDVLVTNNPAGLQLPLADESQIAAIKGVKAVSYRSQLLGYYQRLQNIVFVLPVDLDHFFELEKGEITVSPADLAAFRRTRTGVLITHALGQRYHWKVGDQIPIHALSGAKKDGTSTWTFDIVGYFNLPNSPESDASIMLMGYPYFDTARATDNGTVQMYVEIIDDARQGPVIENAIDNLFANSPARTHTQTERAFAQAAIAQIGNLDFFIDAILIAAFLSLLLLTATTLMQSYRERTAEFAVMKTLGFTDAGVAALVLSEAILLSVVAAVLGLLIAQGSLHALHSLAGQLPALNVPRIVFLAGIAGAVAFALVSALPPAWSARRLSIVDALAGR